jgi:hypothetical protein
MPKSGSLAPLNTNPRSNPKSMKTAQTKRNRFVSYLRFTASSAFFAAAAAFALVAATTNVLSTPGDSTATKPRLMKPSMQDRVAGVARERSDKDGSLGDAFTAALEEYSKRAYPAKTVSFDATMNAIVGVKRFMATSASASSSSPASKSVADTKRKSPPEAPRFNTWSLIGPSIAPDPNILTFSGSPYVTSGRVTAIAVDTNPGRGCFVGSCRVWVAAAGGGIWRTTNALDTTPSWTFLTQLNFSTNAVGALTFVDDGSLNGILYAGTGEPNASADSEAGLGIFKSTNGGNTWTPLACQTGPLTTTSPNVAAPFPNNGTYTGNAFFNRSIGQIVVDPTNPNLLYVSSTRGVRGVDSTYGGPTANPPSPRPPYGLFKSTDGGGHFSFIWDGGDGCPGTCNGTNPKSSMRGVTDVRLDPSNTSIIYAATYPNTGDPGSGGVWRSTDAGVTWAQIKSSPNATTDNSERAGFDVVSLGGGVTRMYVNISNTGAHVFRSDNAQGAATFTDLTAAEAPAGQSSNTCTGQCWYDNVVIANKDFPQVVWVGGSFSYNEFNGKSNGRALIVSQDNGNSWFDATGDATTNPAPPGSCCQPNAVAYNGLHPDHHAIAVIPQASNPNGVRMVFNGSDGGMVRVGDGNFFPNISSQCSARVGVTIFSPADLALCQQLLTAVPPINNSMNNGLATLQFMSLSVASNNPFHVQGGTQDNGTFETYGSFTWPQEIYGDGGQSGFSVTNSNLRFNSFFFQQHDANFRNGDPAFWVVIGGPIFGDGVLSNFYPAIIADPLSAAAGTIFQGTRHVWRTQDWAGSQAFLETNCPEFTTSSSNPACGDFVPLGGPAGTNTAGDLGGTVYGADRRPSSPSRLVNVIERTTANTFTAWAATSGGRVFISTNVDGPAGSVIWNRLDADIPSGPSKTNDPTRVPTGIAINPVNTFQSWISYSGYNFNTPNQPGHIFSVTWTGAGTATWTNISSNLPDIPLTSVVFDPVKGDLYISSDFIVFRLASGHTIWDVAGMGMPLVEVPKLTINPSPGNPATAFLYAGTHGLSAWRLPLYRP